MRGTSHRKAVMAAAFLVGASIAGGPPLAAAVFDATNADQVDGRHAVGAGASVTARAGKLVATNAAGRLPNNIVSTVPNSARLGGLGTAAYQRRVTGSCPAGTYAAAFGAGGAVTCAADRINGGDAATLDGKNAVDFQRAAMRTILVSAGGTPTENGAALRAALASIPTSGAGAPSGANQWLLDVDPGLFDLGVGGLVLGDYIHLRGAGLLTGVTASTTGVPANDAVGRSVLVIDDDSSVSSLRVYQQPDGAGISQGIYIRGDRVSVSEVGVWVSSTVQGLGMYGVVVESNGDDVSLRDLDVSVTGAGTVIGVQFTGSTPGAPRNVLRDSVVDAESSTSNALGFFAGGPTTAVIRSDITAKASGQSARALESNGGTTVVDASSLTADASAATPVSIYQPGPASNTIRMINSRISGPLSNSGTLSCIGAFGPTFAALSASCT